MANSHRDSNATITTPMHRVAPTTEPYRTVKYKPTSFFNDTDRLRLSRIGIPSVESLTMEEVEKATVLQLRAYLTLYDAAVEGTRRRPKSRVEVDTFYEHWIRYRDLTNNQTRLPPPKTRPTAAPSKRSKSRPPPARAPQSSAQRSHSRPPRAPTHSRPMSFQRPAVQQPVLPPKLPPIIAQSSALNAVYMNKLPPLMSLTSPITPSSPSPPFGLVPTRNDEGRQDQSSRGQSDAAYRKEPEWPMKKRSDRNQVATLTGIGQKAIPTRTIHPSPSTAVRTVVDLDGTPVPPAPILQSSKSLIAEIAAADLQKKKLQQQTAGQIPKRVLILSRPPLRVSLEQYATRLHANRLRQRQQAAAASAATVSGKWTCSAEDEEGIRMALQTMTETAILKTNSAVAELAARPRYVAPDLATMRGRETRRTWRLDAKHGIDVNFAPLRWPK